MATKVGFYYYSKEELDEIFTYSSDEEVAVGKWINGKTLYRKVIVTDTLPDNSTLSTPHEIDNVQFIVDIRGVACLGSGSRGKFLPLPYAVPGNYNANIAVEADATNVNITTGMSTYATNGYVAFVVLLYTKN